MDYRPIALNPPVWWTPSGIYGIEGPSEICTQSAEMWLAVSGAQLLFTLGLLMFALSLVDIKHAINRTHPTPRLSVHGRDYHLRANDCSSNAVNR